MNKKFIVVIGTIVIVSVVSVGLMFILPSDKIDDNTKSKDYSTKSTSLTSVTKDEKYSTSDSEEGNVPEADHLDIYDAKYEKRWKSEDDKIVFTTNNKLGLDGRGSYEGICRNSDSETKICITIDDYRYWNKKYSLNLKNDGRLTMDMIISEDGVDIQTIIFGGYYIIDDKNNKFTVTVDSVHNKYLKTGYKKGDKIVFCQVIE